MEHIVFVCAHGGAKSLIAAEYFTRFAAEHGIAMRGAAGGIDPYEEVPQPVVAGLAAKGIDVEGYVPRQASDATVAKASMVIHFGCDLAIPEGLESEDWGDIPAVSEDFDRAHDAIVARVARLARQIADSRRDGAQP